MQIGDLVRDIYGDELLIITSKECDGYYDVYGIATGKEWIIPKEHLEVINESR